MLDKEGTLLAFLLAAVITYFGGFQYLLLMLTFLLLAVVVTKYENQSKRLMGIYEHERSWENVLANGVFPTILVILTPVIGPMPYIGAVSALTSDKFASELGVLGGKPIYLGTLKSVKAGKSGSISLLGTIMSLAGAAIIGAVCIFIFGITPMEALFVSLVGFIGSIVDTMFGILEEHGIGTKGTTNLICSITGALLIYLLTSSW